MAGEKLNTWIKWDPERILLQESIFWSSLFSFASIHFSEKVTTMTYIHHLSQDSFHIKKVLHAPPPPRGKPPMLHSSNFVVDLLSIDIIRVFMDDRCHTGIQWFGCVERSFQRRREEEKKMANYRFTDEEYTTMSKWFSSEWSVHFCDHEHVWK